MAVLSVSKLGRNVDTIADRDNISFRPDGLIVNVKDAIGDPAVGGGSAIYKWNKEDGRWILVSKEKRDVQYFATEIKSIDSDGIAVLDNTPTSSIMWDTVILDDDDTILEELYGLDVDGNEISGLEDYAGKRIKTTFAYGEITDSLDKLLTAIDDRLRNLETSLASLETVDLNEE